MSILINKNTKVITVAADVGTADGCRKAYEAADKAFGPIDVLVNNAYHGGDFSTVLDADLAGWRDVFDVNLYGALHLTRAAVQSGHPLRAARARYRPGRPQYSPGIPPKIC